MPIEALLIGGGGGGCSSRIVLGGGGRGSVLLSPSGHTRIEYSRGNRWECITSSSIGRAVRFSCV